MTDFDQFIHGVTIILSGSMIVTGLRLATSYLRAARRARSWQLVPDACFMIAWICTGIGIIANQRYRWHQPIRWWIQGPITLGFLLFIVAAVSLEHRAARERRLSIPHRRKDDVAIRPLHPVVVRDDAASRR